MFFLDILICFLLTSGAHSKLFLKAWKGFTHMISYDLKIPFKKKKSLSPYIAPPCIPLPTSNH